MLSPKSIPDVTPPAVITLPSLTIRAFSYVAPTSGSNSVNAQCVVARRPFSNPRGAENKGSRAHRSDILRRGRLPTNKFYRLPISHRSNDPGAAAWYADQIQPRAILKGMRRYETEAAIARN